MRPPGTARGEDGCASRNRPGAQPKSEGRPLKMDHPTALLAWKMETSDASLGISEEIRGSELRAGGY